MKVIGFLLFAASITSSCAATTAPSEANKKLVLDFWRIVIEARNVDAAEQFYVPDFIQHNPLMKNGIDAFKARAKVLFSRPCKIHFIK